MTPLANWILRQGKQSTPADQILAGLTASVVLSTDTTLHGYVWVARNYGDAAAEGILAAIQGAGLPGAAAAYTSYGFDLSDQLTQDKLDAIALAVPTLATLCGQLKRAGINGGQQWQVEQLPTQPTFDTITSALAEVVNFLQVENFNLNCVQVAINAGKSIPEIKALVAAYVP